jgi:hypothetical protein
MCARAQKTEDREQKTESLAPAYGLQGWASEFVMTFVSAHFCFPCYVACLIYYQKQYNGVLGHSQTYF